MNLRPRFLALPLLFLLQPLTAFAAGSETVNALETHALIRPDGHMVVQEDITYDFGGISRHGIYRYIPVDYRRSGARYRMDLSVNAVTRDGRPESYQVSNSGENVYMRIGDPDMTITGQHAYGISYVVNKEINFFPDHDELYWNVIGNGWDVPIEQASFYMPLPVGISPESVSTTCYVGVIGSTQKDCSVQFTDGNIEFRATRLMAPEEGLTVVIGFPKGIVHEPTALERFWQILIDNLILAIPLITFIVMFGLWWVRGRDAKLGTIIAQYEAPDGLPPAVIQALWSYGEAGGRGITATILDLAKRGYLHIIFTDKKTLFGGVKHQYSLKRMKEADDKLAPFEKVLFDAIFADGPETDVLDLSTRTFSLKIQELKRDITKNIEEMHVFEAMPGRVRGLYIVLGILPIAVLYFMGGRMMVELVAAILTSVSIWGFGWNMPRRNAKGTRLEERIEGFRLFLSVTETDRVAFHDAPEKRPEQFSQFLPHAIAFGIEEQWAKQFAGMDIPQPEWAEGMSMHNMGVIGFAHGLGDFHKSASSVYMPPSSAGGGGSGFSGGGSGGGFGGGGGGSW